MPHDSPQPATRPAAAVDLHTEPTCDYAADAAAAELVRILDQYLADLKSGQAPSREELIARHPALASQLEACLAGLEFIHGAEHAAPGRAQRLGDFRIIREVGRGGMGAVFEAEQISLGRRVALKILRFGGVSDPEAIERFQREAETVAKLHHTNIVPIFAVGSERGVNYYAMQFIDGQSLAEVLAKVLAERHGPLPADRVADWGLQAAEALAHAHQRGVIHRDVKPSNLLLDNEQRLWLTDFGLARRLDDVTLSMTGALLGTPRYMSPEQAVASKKRIDHRSDLFSLGATLYELLTGKPAFAGETPHDVIQQILKGEPIPIRQLNQAVPRDLETIVMKCLAKEPAQRYGAAQDLAADLRAFLDGRPIRARRASPVELAIRWVRQHQRNVALTSAAAAVTLLVTLAGLFGRSSYEAWRQAAIRLDAISPPLVAEFLDERGDVVRVDTLPMQTAAQLPAGEYALRVSGDGTLSQNFEVGLERGQSLGYTVNLHDQLLLGAQGIDGTFDVVDLGDERAVVSWTQEGVTLRKRRGPQLGWSMKLAPESGAAMAVAPGFRWPWTSPQILHSGYGPFAYQPWLAPQAVDVNGDGTGDLIAAGRHQAWLMALSGQDGSLLWIAPRSEQLTQPLPKEWRYRSGDVRSAVLGEPILLADYDGDDVPEILATLVDIPPNPSIQQNRYACTRWVEAVSGKTGQTVWRYDLPDSLFEIPAGTDVPYDLRWFGADGGTTSYGAGSMIAGRHISRDRPHQERTGAHLYRPSAATLITLAGQTRAAIVAGTHVVLLDPASGKPLDAPVDLGARPGKDPQWADVDGDGSSDLVFLEELVAPAFPRIPAAKLYVWSSGRRKQLWSLPLDAYWPQRAGWTVDAPQWPLVVDLNGDRRFEIVVPHGRPPGAGTFGGRLGTNQTPWGTLTAWEGDTGREIWSRKLVSMDSQVDSFLDGPDLDGDGTREVFAVTLAGNDFSVYVDALSGATGKTLWTNHQAPRNDRGTSASFVLAPPVWWQSGDDGWPQLLVQVLDEQNGSRHSLICAFSAGTGRLTHHGYGITAVRPADLDRDGLEDLLIFTSNSPGRFDLGGNLKCLRGVGGQPWKRLGALGEPTSDLDGDGVLDLIRSWGDGTLIASSGAAGRELWRSRPIPAVDELGVKSAGSPDPRETENPAPSPAGDLDGNGSVDLLVWERSSGGRGIIPPLHAVSGRTGRLLWTISEVKARMLGGTLAAGSRDLDGDGQEEVIWLTALDHNYPQRLSFSTSDVQLWLFVMSGQTGRLQWSQALSPQYGLAPGSTAAYQFHNVELSLAGGDLNGDGTLDLLAPAVTEQGTLELRALSGQDGKLLWSRPRQPDGLSQESLRNWTAPTICDLNGDGRSEVVLAEPMPMRSSAGVLSQEVGVVALDGDTGRERWSRPTGAVYTHFHSFSPRRGDMLRPVVLRAGRKQQRIGVYLPGGDDKFVIVDSDGQMQERKLSHQPQPVGLWTCDADGDGVDEVVFVDQSTLIAAPADRLGEALWKRPLGTIGQQQILKIEPPSGKRPPVIVLVTDPTDNSVLGIDAATGRTVWSCPGPNSRDPGDGVYMVPSRIALLGARPEETPLVYYAMGFVAECRQAVRALAEDRPGTQAHGGAVSLASRGVAVATAKVDGLDLDSRWQRDLPWRSELELGGGRVAGFIGWGTFFSLTLVVIPVGYTLRLIIQRRFSLQALLVLPVVAGIFLTAALIQGPAESHLQGLVPRLISATGFAPPVVGLGLLVWWLARGRWKRASIWLGLVLVMSAIAAASIISTTLRHAPLLPEESLDWTGWYFILAVGAYMTSWLAMIVLPIEFLIRAVWRRLVARRTGAMPAFAAAEAGPQATAVRSAPKSATVAHRR
jgi:outer membrane protein assembly factor BamB